MIVVEGPDGAGKTTLVQKLLTLFGEDLMLGKRATDNRDDLWKVTKIDTYRALHLGLGYPEDDDPVIEIWDRLFWSEFVYWDLVGRDHPEFNEQDKEIIPNVIAGLDSLVIWCLPTKPTVMANIESEGHQMLGVKERAEEIFNRYSMMRTDRQLVPKRLSGRFFLYDYTGERVGRSLYEIEKAVGGIIQRRKARLG
jgi:energy-coupling factor transporter ATP-binding protein EcfA2